MGRKIYLGRNLESVIQATADMVEQLQDVMETMQDVAENTKYIRNLYDAVDLRGSVSYSASAANLVGQAYSEFFGFTQNSGSTTQTTNYVIENGLQLYVNASGAGTASKSGINLSGVRLLTFSAKMSSSTGTLAVVVGSISKSFSVSAAFQNFEVEIPEDIGSSVSISFTGGSGGVVGNRNLQIIDIHCLDADGNIVGNLMPGKNYTAVSNAFAIPDGLDSGRVVLTAPAPADPVSKWDLLSILADSPENVEVTLMRPDGMYLQQLKSGDLIEIGTTNFLTMLDFHRPAAGMPNTISSVAYRYIK